MREKEPKNEKLVGKKKKQQEIISPTDILNFRLLCKADMKHRDVFTRCERKAYKGMTLDLLFHAGDTKDFYIQRDSGKK